MRGNYRVSSSNTCRVPWIVDTWAMTVPDRQLRVTVPPTSGTRREQCDVRGQLPRILFQRVSRALDRRQTLRAMTVPDQQLRVTVPPDTSGTDEPVRPCAANYAYPLPTRVSRALDHRQTLRAMTVPDQQLHVTVPPDTSEHGHEPVRLVRGQLRRISSNRVACPGSSTNVAGDDSTGSATACDCPSNSTWDSVAGQCECDAGFRVDSSNNGAWACGTGYTNAAGDVVAGSSVTATLCDTCAANYRVSSSHRCVACPGSSTNVAGDDVTGSETACDCPTDTSGTRARSSATRARPTTTCRRARAWRARLASLETPAIPSLVATRRARLGRR